MRCLTERSFSEDRFAPAPPPDTARPPRASGRRSRCARGAVTRRVAGARHGAARGFRGRLRARVAGGGAVLPDDFDACIAHLRFPLRHRKVIRTTNLLERLFLEERRRTKVVPHAFGERPVLKLMFAAVIRAADRWRGLSVGEFEQRQLQAIREELDRAHARRTAPAVAAAPTATTRKLRG